jgi:hypothetical protein
MPVNNLLYYYRHFFDSAAHTSFNGHVMHSGWSGSIVPKHITLAISISVGGTTSGSFGFAASGAAV